MAIIRIFYERHYHAHSGAVEIERQWLCFSPTMKKPYCQSCWLFGDPQAMQKEWAGGVSGNPKNFGMKIKSHEKTHLMRASHSGDGRRVNALLVPKNRYCITLYFRGRKISRKVNLKYFREKKFSRMYCSRENIFPRNILPRKYLLAKISSRENIFPRKYPPAKIFSRDLFPCRKYVG